MLPINYPGVIIRKNGTRFTPKPTIIRRPRKKKLSLPLRLFKAITKKDAYDDFSGFEQFRVK